MPMTANVEKKRQSDEKARAEVLAKKVTADTFKVEFISYVESVVGIERLAKIMEDIMKVDANQLYNNAWRINFWRDCGRGIPISFYVKWDEEEHIPSYCNPEIKSLLLPLLK